MAGDPGFFDAGGLGDVLGGNITKGLQWSGQMATPQPSNYELLKGLFSSAAPAVAAPAVASAVPAVGSAVGSAVPAAVTGTATTAAAPGLLAAAGGPIGLAAAGVGALLSGIFGQAKRNKESQIKMLEAGGEGAQKMGAAQTAGLSSLMNAYKGVF